MSLDRLAARARCSLVAVPLAFAAACGPSDRTSPTSGVDGGRGGDGGPEGELSINGTVWTPGNAPGQVPAGHEIPVYDAVVYLGTEKPDPIPQQVFCDSCTDGPPNAVTTDHKGNFTITRAPVGETRWLVIQKGQFRVEREITIGEEHRNLPATMTTLPSETNEAAGTWIPRIALASGLHDEMESILGKLAIGEVDGSGSFVSTTAAGHFDVYSNSGSLDHLAIGSLAELVASLEMMSQYHIIFIPCSSDDGNEAALRVQQNLRNMRDYVKAGGRLYVADWSGEWMDMVFPEQVELNGEYDTPAEAYDRATDTWDTSLMGSADDDYYDSEDAEVTDDDMFQWLDGQAGPSGVFDASSFLVEDNWNKIIKTNPVEIGVDLDGMPVIDTPKVYVIGENDVYPSKMAEVVTFEPAGCGRVLYSTFHTVPEVHPGLVPQERILAYLLMEIGVCTDDPVVE